MLDINAFLVEKGGEPEKIKESQRKEVTLLKLLMKLLQIIRTGPRLDLT